ncbi:MAG: glutamate--tRNA ligase [Candidatus Wildermuthbacteria bacterium RIFCSPHIGHO2_01_FULL_45_20]|uniref:Glutamate--tRNA ligase n=1 Tax=Candidatus Wildermuthbacteria bacterium RIFCSPHIGHO2_02_FULL_45_25 TaxID=1802450 RepID=A0A1G2QY19_9BACT|nr:MAG: glutamate--tRNA ligase [Candidatus Wildermuthbacteria bacterium RIFCSPHIGHO2_01_FULL_45_20]OHA65248.1 MAG: glutamate--tRNA ligase [Candidatus Wildermuthbacteria bacterium RIFCSPHIGHO2_02_FULL_45_25]
MSRQSTPQSVRVRIAPSPTGPIHMGNVRAGLFNYLFAKQQGGVFMLRIEDTDKERSKPEWEKDIFENMQWLGLLWDEGPDPAHHGASFGQYGPYRQSERTELYKKYLLKLLAEGKAYYCFCASDELEAQRSNQMSLGEAPRYLGTCRQLAKDQQEKKFKEGKPAVIRFIVEPKVVVFDDLIRGKVSFDMSLAGDIVIAKNLETPLYNFTVVIDDYEMKITHVIRGEDHIPNTPKQILLQQALGFPGAQFGHLPLLLGTDRTKLSKRHGDHSVTRYRKEGYLPEAVLNFLALLGWNPGGEKEIFTLQELVEDFSLKRIQKGGAVFNVQRLDWINGYYIRQMPIEELTRRCIPFLINAGLIDPWPDVKGEEIWYMAEKRPFPEGILKEEDIQKVISLYKDTIQPYQDRLKKLSELPEMIDFFFVDNLDYPKELLLWKDADAATIAHALERAKEILSGIADDKWTREHLEEVLMPFAEQEKNRGYMLWPLRVALSGKKASAGPFEICSALGKEKTLRRIQFALEKF